MPKRFAMIVGQRIAKERLVAEEKGLRAKDNVGKSRDDQEQQHQTETPRGQPLESAFGGCLSPINGLDRCGRGDFRCL